MKSLSFFPFLLLLMVGCQVKQSQAQQVRSSANGPIAQTQSNQGAVKQSVKPLYNSLFPSSGQRLNVLVQLQADKATFGKRPPLDLMLTLDKSGSMRGDKLRDSKTAAMNLVDQLRPDDRVTLISYSSSVNMSRTFEMNTAGKQALKQRIMGVVSGGSTALGPALFRAFDTLRARRDTGRVRHVILMSDGRANVGVSDPAVIGARAANAFKSGISVSSIGVGLDYNEDLMTQVADMGGGRYHFIEKSELIAEILTGELNGIAGTVARDVNLAFENRDGIRLEKAFGYPVSHEAGRSTVRVGFMLASQKRDIMLELVVPPRSGLDIGSAFDIGQIALTYEDLNQDGLRISTAADIPVTVSASLDESKKTENQDVKIRLTELRAAERLKIAAAKTGNGDFSGAKSSLSDALKVMRKQNRATPSKKLRKQIVEFESAYLELDAAPSSATARKRYSKKYKSKAYGASKR